MIDILKAYNEYLEDNKGCQTWFEYYNLYVVQKWVRGNKQRNYQRNKDIIYKSTSTKRNNQEVKYELVPLEGNGNFYLYQNCYLQFYYVDSGYSTDLTVDKVHPFKYIKMWVEDIMNLTADIPNIILDAEFEIDNNGNLILKYG